MYGIPDALDLSAVAGTSSSELRVGQFDLQFTFGPVRFAVQSPINLFRGGKMFAHWEKGRWPEPGFFDLLNVNIIRCEVRHNRLIVLEFENGIAMHLEDSSDQFECMQIYFDGEPAPWII